MQSLIGTGALVRFALRRDRIILPIWIVLLTAVVASTAASFAELYPTEAARQQVATGFGSNPSLLALYGPLFDSTLGSLTVWRAGTIGSVLIPLMSLFTVVRHTRAEEEAGRLELLESGVVGRDAALTAALLVAAGANLVLATTITLGLIGAGLPAIGSIAAGLAWACAGLLFTGVAGITAQLSESSRAANGMAVGVVGVFFLLRAAGDSAGDAGVSWLSWLSPIGWTQQIRPYADERWWLFAVLLALIAGLIGTAYALDARRDIGAGLLPRRPGPAVGHPRLRTPFALAWRLQRGALLGWTAGFLVLGGVLGSVAQGVGELLETTPLLAEIFERMGGQQAIIDAYLAATLGIIGIIAAGYGVQATLRLRSEENGLRAEPILAAGVQRIPWRSATSSSPWAAPPCCSWWPGSPLVSRTG